MAILDSQTLTPLGIVATLGLAVISYVVWLITFFMEHKSLKEQVKKQGESFNAEIESIKKTMEADNKDVLIKLGKIETQQDFILNSIGRLEGILLNKGSQD